MNKTLAGGGDGQDTILPPPFIGNIHDTQSAIMWAKSAKVLVSATKKSYYKVDRFPKQRLYCICCWAIK